ncbi:hypothetical protein ACIHIX_31450 [Streptomyces sp. NPDC051913]|uniref:hypothetical protein n=1 Tax=Streptomyces sp. NPDC051913 TaxID=3365676 RepID=UPI0037CF889F
MTGNPEEGVRGAVPGALVEVACDESGSDGENLTGGNTDVFAHGSVEVPVETAAAYLLELRERIRSPAEEYKANHLLREKHRAALESLLAASGPLYGHAHVHLTEKAYFVVDRAAALLLDDSHDGADGHDSHGGAARVLVLYRQGPADFGPDRWRTFLEAANHLLRVRGNGEPDEPVAAFFRTIAALRRAAPRPEVAHTLERLAATRTRADAYRARVGEHYPLIPALNPLLPAIVHTATHWSAGGRRTVRLVHDRQNMLTPDRIAWIEETAGRAGVGFDGMELVQARWDPRIQLADFLAGIARKIASDVLNGRGDPALVALLRPYVGPTSVWGDERSWAVLSPNAPNGVVSAPSADADLAV